MEKIVHLKGLLVITPLTRGPFPTDLRRGARALNSGTTRRWDGNPRPVWRGKMEETCSFHPDGWQVFFDVSKHECFIDGFGGGFRQIFLFCIFSPNLGEDEPWVTSHQTQGMTGGWYDWERVHSKYFKWAGTKAWSFCFFLGVGTPMF